MVYLDNLQKRKTAGGKELLSFNVILHSGEDDVVYVHGLTLVNGFINPPNFRSGATYYGITHFSPSVASAIYAAVAQRVKEFPDIPVLQPEAVAIEALKLSPVAWLRQFPTLAAKSNG